MRHMPALGFVAGLALARAVAKATGLGVDAGLVIKWPNDLLWQGAKFAGILLEGTQTPQGQFAVAIGIGVNCLSHPPGLLYPTTCLANFASSVLVPSDVLTALSETMVDALGLWDGGANFAAIRREWLGLAMPSGSDLTVKLPGGARRGRFQTIDALGRLVIETEVGPLTVEAADVFLTVRGDPGTVQSR